MSVRFNENACLTALREFVVATLIQVQEEYIAEAKSHMLTPEGADSLKPDEITALGEYIMANIIGGAWAAMDEWGTGSLLDDSNPAFADYRASELWNPARYDNTIRSRERGSYINIFGQTVMSKSNISGIDIEDKYPPQPPSHAMQTAARWMMNGRIQTIWKEAMMAFPWGNFIIATSD